MMIDAGSSSPDMTSIPWPQEQIQHHNASMVGTSLAGRSCRMSCARRRRARACAHALLAASDDALPCGGGYSALSSLLPPLILVGNHCAQLNHENCGTNWFLNRLSVSLVAWVKTRRNQTTYMATKSSQLLPLATANQSQRRSGQTEKK